MARQYQSHNSDVAKSSTSSKKKNKTKKKKRKAKKEKVFSLGFVVMSLVIAAVLFFVFLIVGIQVGPNLPI